jgi:hypothetical protein
MNFDCLFLLFVINYYTISYKIPCLHILTKTHQLDMYNNYQNVN